MLYQVHFNVNGLENLDKVEKLKKVVNEIDGVKNVEIIGRNKVSVTYNPSKVIPSQLTAMMNSVGVNSHKG